MSQPQASEAIRVRAGFLRARHLGRGPASPSDPLPTEMCMRTVLWKSHHDCPGGKWGAEKQLPGQSAGLLKPYSERLILVTTLRPSLALGESFNTHINIHRYTAPPHATSRYLLITLRSLLTSLLGPDCGCWILRNLALSYFGWALQSTAGMTNLSSCVRLALHKRGQIPTDSQEPQAWKKREKICLH